MLIMPSLKEGIGNRFGILDKFGVALIYKIKKQN